MTGTMGRDRIHKTGFVLGNGCEDVYKMLSRARLLRRLMLCNPKPKDVPSSPPRHLLPAYTPAIRPPHLSVGR